MLYLLFQILIMPAFDGTGPAGQGPMTGRGQGPCAGGAPGGAQGRGRGWGNGRGRGWGGYPFINTQNGWRFWERNTTSLEEQEKSLEEELKAIREERKKQKN